ncbi:MAG: SH3 domain-containing protein [Polyangiaceae bacterium]|nr:SH3 domain-containing protein [Polyangiaceae bacterium]
MARSRPATVEIPTPDQDRPRFARVGMVAVAGFVIGIAWPWLAGVRFAPSAPVDELTRPPSSTDAKLIPHASAAGRPPAAAKPPPAKPEPVQRIAVGKATVTSCRNADNKILPACDPIEVDPVLVPRLQALQDCPGSEEARGVLSIGVKIDFVAGKIADVVQGKSTTVDGRAAHALIACAEKGLASISLKDVAHAQADYTVFYLMEITPAAEVAGDEPRRENKAEDGLSPASGMATVAWVAARVRKEPDKESPELGRLLSGTRVKVLGRKGDWYKIKYNAKGDEGWVFKSAIGL